jgi:hypothetical protein
MKGLGALSPPDLARSLTTLFGNPRGLPLVVDDASISYLAARRPM